MRDQLRSAAGQSFKISRGIPQPFYVSLYLSLFIGYLNYDVLHFRFNQRNYIKVTFYSDMSVLLVIFVLKCFFDEGI